MKATGIVRRIDDLGRISIPKEIRERIFGTKDTEGMTIELFMDDDSIVLKKYVGAEEEKEAKIRSAAIDEFLRKICEKYTCEERKGNHRQYCSNIKQEIADIAEEMKGMVK